MAEDHQLEVKAGDLISYRLWNRLVSALRRCVILDNAGGGLDIRRGPEGTTLTVIAEGTEVAPVQAPAAGIPGKVGNTPGQAVCTLYTWDGTSQTLGTSTVLVRNDYPGAVGNNKFFKYHTWAGVIWVLTESCQ